mmetsp:Transcript_33975/g.52945  ORF Transcript_33975/g.52945 Transcript_33975/m.52945 type:complete len:386 (-) Transcript_33975:45-1202(-)
MSGINRHRRRWVAHLAAQQPLCIDLASVKTCYRHCSDPLHDNLNPGSSTLSIPHSDTSDSDASPRSRVGVDWVGDNSHGIRRRSMTEAPPVGSPVNAWGKYDTPEEILSRPKPPKPGHGTTMGKHGGRWSYYQPVNEIYLISKKSLQAPGPGSYGQDGAPDPILSNRNAAFGKMTGGKFSKFRPPTDVEIKMKSAAAVPGPGAYDTEHLYGIYKSIEAGNPNKKREFSREVSREPSRQSSRASSRASSRPGSSEGFAETLDPAKELIASVWPEASEVLLKTWGDRPVDIVSMEQALVMSRIVPLEKFNRLSTTRYSRLRKDTLKTPVRRFPGRSKSAMSSTRMSGIRGFQQSETDFLDVDKDRMENNLFTPNPNAPNPGDSDSDT